MPPVFSIEVRRVIEGEIEVEADDADAAREQVESVSEVEFDRMADVSVDEVEVIDVVSVDNEGDEY